MLSVLEWYARRTHSIWVWALFGLVSLLDLIQFWAWSHLELWVDILIWAIVVLVGPYWAMWSINDFYLGS